MLAAVLPAFWSLAVLPGTLTVASVERYAVPDAGAVAMHAGGGKGHAESRAGEADRREILDGVREIAAPGIPGTIGVFGPRAFPLVVGRIGDVRSPVAAASSLERGRIVLLGHDGFFGSAALDTADTGRFIRQALRWSTRGKAGIRVGVIGAPEIVSFLVRNQIEAEAIGTFDDPSPYDAVFITHPDLSDNEVERLRTFVRRGGALLSASTPWGWQTITRRGLPVHPINRVVAGAGLMFTDGMLDRTSAAGFDATADIPELVDAGVALERLAQPRTRQALSPDEVAQAVASVLQVGVNLPADDSEFRPRLERIRRQLTADATVSERNPVTLSDPIRRIALALDTVDAQRAPASEVGAHPSAGYFPGSVPEDARPVVRQIAIPPGRTGWQSLGLYAAPGQAVKVRVPSEWVGKGYAVRIGAHTDELWGLREWKRAPAVARRFPIESAETLAANAFGGLVYLEVPEGAGRPGGSVSVEGAFESPLFELGKTDPDDWRARIRHLPGPWAELATDKVVVTVPSSVVRELDDPVALMEFWDRVLDACADLAAWPRERSKAERMVADVQISAGYMHAGYPIMTHLDAASLVVDLDRLRSEGSWGHFHELGHNHQHADWTFDGTVEVTVNLFSMYITESVRGKPFDSGHPAIRDRNQRMERVRRFIESGAPFAQWQSDPFLALTMYIQIVEEFGWDAIKGTIAEYRGLPAAERPRTDAEKRDQWMVRLSRRVGRNLGPFFEKWGVPTSLRARDSLADLPAWMPAELVGLGR
ncbi:MAG: M60 family metallopeptidase [Fimbriimonadaceae bacterium]